MIAGIDKVRDEGGHDRRLVKERECLRAARGEAPSKLDQGSRISVRHRGLENWRI